MQDGIYHVSFSSNANDFGQGIAVLKGNSINGGDRGYVYSGTKDSTEADEFLSRLRIKQWNTSVPSVFGPVKEFELELIAKASGDKGFVANGHVVGQPQSKITIRGKFVGAAT